MSFTYDPTTALGKVRLRISDKYAANVIFQDAEIEAFLEDERSNVKRASAAALDTIAADEALVQKVITILNLSTNGAATASALSKLADKLREQADIEDSYNTNDELFDIAEQVVDDFSRRDRLYNQALRNDL